MPKIAKYALICAAIGLGLALSYTLATTPKSAPALSFKTINGQSLSLNQFKGKPVLITFWASDCQSCLAEIPDLVTLHQQGLTIIAVAMPYDPPNRVLAIATEKQLPYPIALDPNAEINTGFGGIPYTPTSFLINPQGQIIHHHTGKLELPAVQALLRDMG
ncbi:TlpA family protein disulfide reductase [Methylomonas paludis]|uniref:TlpA family protein disulfide reductase n=1 Tax=Methylomonas paludis TaxID=1173101 RepID=A0A975RB50_9GAMM|nr:TlpA disulfide reductase family protein [Methylomonas paludis]QWF72033.1 TlpA family protein disulfide reductase [Methylomonas paludis]